MTEVLFNILTTRRTAAIFVVLLALAIGNDHKQFKPGEWLLDLVVGTVVGALFGDPRKEHVEAALDAEREIRSRLEIEAVANEMFDPWPAPDRRTNALVYFIRRVNDWFRNKGVSGFARLNGPDRMVAHASRRFFSVHISARWETDRSPRTIVMGPPMVSFVAAVHRHTWLLDAITWAATASFLLLNVLLWLTGENLPGTFGIVCAMIFAMVYIVTAAVLRRVGQRTFPRHELRRLAAQALVLAQAARAPVPSDSGSA